MKLSPWLRGVLVAVVVAGYPLLMHWLLTSNQWPSITLFVGLLPLALPPLGLLQTAQRLLGVVLLATLLLGAFLLWQTMLRQPEWIYLIQNVAMQGLLAWVFGRTLFAPHEALISQLARRLHHADFTPVIASYTRGATWAWVGFFVAMTLISVGLFAAAPLEIWSFFINVLYLPLLGLMFLLEYIARRICLRGVNHVSIIKGIAVYWEKPAAPIESTHKKT